MILGQIDYFQSVQWGRFIFNLNFNQPLKSIVDLSLIIDLKSIVEINRVALCLADLTDLTTGYNK